MSKDQDQHQSSIHGNEKEQQLKQYQSDSQGQKMTTNQGLRISDDEHSLKAGDRGPTLMEDFHFREKMTHFDHERIPERIVHARGFGAHGHFHVYEPLTEFTKAKFLQDPSIQTPVFVRYSTVAGSRGSGDTVRDVRGFATKFYTEEGNYDLVGNNIPVFFIQDAIKFPDLVHSFKPEPHNEMPQASTAHDTFWDFVANNTESAHMIMWIMSDRAIPRSYRMMEGFGVHTFRLVNEQGESHFVKFHWKPVLGVHSLVWDEAQKIAGKDPDFHRRDLWEAIEMGNYPEFELGVQLIKEEDEFKFNFDILDPTKLWPEELIPVRRIGKMTLTRNTDNVFAETEQSAFHPGHVVPGIDFSNDPLLQGRLFSYTDTQLLRLGGPNFHEIPINKSVAPVHNHQRDGFHRMTINKGPVSYHKNSMEDNDPKPASAEEGGYVHYQEKIEGRKVRERSDSFKDHYSQAKLFWNSMTPVEKEHIIQAFQFEVGKVMSKSIQQQVVDVFSNVDHGLAEQIALAVGVNPPAVQEVAAAAETTVGQESIQASPSLSQENTLKTVKTRKVAVLAENGFDTNEVTAVMNALTAAGITPEIISRHLGTLVSLDEQSKLAVNKTFLTTDSVLYDGIYVAGGRESVNRLLSYREPLVFVNEAYSHYKTVGAVNEGNDLLTLAGISLPNANPAEDEMALTSDQIKDLGVVSVQQGEDVQSFGDHFIDALSQHRHWGRAL